MDNLIHSPLGLVHVLFSLIAMITGGFVLGLRKGTKLHKRIGYTYFASMVGLNGTAFMIYGLFGHFGIFHWAAVFSSLTILSGMVPIIKKKKGWIYRHFNFMYWSVIGLYAAFAAETLTRVPETPFFGMVGLATGIIVLMGVIGLRLHRKKWAAQFGQLGS
jgi:uncharacterized membrane protein